MEGWRARLAAPKGETASVTASHHPPLSPGWIKVFPAGLREISAIKFSHRLTTLFTLLSCEHCYSELSVC